MSNRHGFCCQQRSQKQKQKQKIASKKRNKNCLGTKSILRSNEMLIANIYTSIISTRKKNQNLKNIRNK